MFKLHCNGHVLRCTGYLEVGVRGTSLECLYKIDTKCQERAARAVDPDSLNPNPDTDPDPAFQVKTDSDTDRDPIRIQGFDDQKFKERNTAENFFYLFFDQKLKFTYVQATGEAFSHQKKRTSSTSKNEIY
jgi:hypothetical protein